MAAERSGQAADGARDATRRHDAPPAADARVGEILPAPQGALPRDVSPAEGAALARAGEATRERALHSLQRRGGNAYVQRLVSSWLRSGRGLSAQRQAPAAPAPPAAAKPTFSFVRTASEGNRFNSAYTPVGPVPATGTLQITLNVHITFKDFSRAMMRQEPYRSFRFTRDQLKDFAWTDAEKQAFSRDFQSSVQGAWSGKHPLHLQDPSFSEYRCDVQIAVADVPDAGKAHTKITAQKVPRGAPRFRSFVAGDQATLDIRDPSEPEQTRDASPAASRDYIRQVGPFDFDSAELNGAVSGQLGQVVADLKGLHIPTASVGIDWVIFYVGRASARGSRTYNQQLGQRRARAVEQHVISAMGWPDQGQAMSVGARHASNDPRFQRVDVQAMNLARNRPDFVQNTAAHEAGHMFGLGDEYVEEEPPKDSVPKFLGDEPSHFGDVQAHVGTDAANELLVQDSGSIMSRGGDVKRGHYVYFVEALNNLTSKTWTVE